MAELVAVVCAVVAVVMADSEMWQFTVRPAFARWWQVGLAGLLVAGAVVLPAYGALLALGCVSVLAVMWRHDRHRRWKQVRQTSCAVRDLCRDLADDLHGGQALPDALAAAARRWPPLRPVVLAAELDHDVASALADVACKPGAQGLRAVAAAWRVSQQMGSGLADGLQDVARLLAARERRALLVDAELAAARSTAITVCGLPLFVLGLGSGLGTNPWSFFLTPLGTLVLAVGLALMAAGWWWLDRLTAKAIA